MINEQRKPICWGEAHLDFQVCGLLVGEIGVRGGVGGNRYCCVFQSMFPILKDL